MELTEVAQVNNLSVALLANIKVSEEFSVTVLNQELASNRALHAFSIRGWWGIVRNVTDLLVIIRHRWLHAPSRERTFKANLNLIGEFCLFIQLVL